MELFSKTFLLFLLAVPMIFSLSSCFPSSELDEYIRRSIPSGEVDGYDIATVHTGDLASNTETGLTKRDIENHAFDPSTSKRSISLHLASGERLHMSLHKRSIDTSAATFTELTDKNKRERIPLARRDCYFSGALEEEQGYASLAMCDGKLVGSVTTTKRDFEIHALPEPINKRSTDDVTQVLVTWQDRMTRSTEVTPEFVDDGIEIPEDEIDFDEDDASGPLEVENSLRRRSVEDGQMTIEFSDYVDQNFLQEMADKWNITTNEEIIDVLLIKWTGLAGILSNYERLGWNITLRLIHVEIMRTHPSWYVTSAEDKIKDRLKSFCAGTKAETYDHITLHTGKTADVGKAGIAYVKGMCRPGTRCAVTRASSTKFNVELHELGHNLGLQHDKGMAECETDVDTDKGFMGKSSVFIPECYKQRLAKTIPSLKSGCVFENTFNEMIKDFGTPTDE